MALSRDAFLEVLAALGELLPMARALSPQAIALAWGLFPLTAKELLTPEHLLFAMQQLQADPDPQRDLSVPLQLLRYLFPLENGRPVYGRGLRPDLDERMRRPERFHPLQRPAEQRPVAEVIAEQRLSSRAWLGPASLALDPPSASGQMQGVVEQVQQSALPLLLAARSAVEAAGADSCPFTPEQLATGALLAAGSLVGRWRLEQIRLSDGRPCLAEAWIRTHPRGWAAMQLSAQALGLIP